MLSVPSRVLYSFPDNNIYRLYTQINLYNFNYLKDMVFYMEAYF